MEADELLIDGYSLLHRAGLTDKRALESRRVELLRRIARHAARLAPRVTVVFDGRDRGGFSPSESQGLHVEFAPGHQTADTVIERRVAHRAPGLRVCVVTSDRAEQQTVTSAGAEAMSCGVFLDILEGFERAGARTRRKAFPKPCLGDFLDGFDR